MRFVMTFLAIAGTLAVPAAADARDLWTKQAANTWYARQAWPVGANYVPANAINQLEMWQAETFDPAVIDKELGWAEGLGMNTMRVFVHNLLWEADPEGLKRRMDAFLKIAARHHIRPVFVLFDSCWDPNPVAGPQHPPIPGVHNSGWVQGPGRGQARRPAGASETHRLCEGYRGPVREGRPRAGVGRVERTQ